MLVYKLFRRYLMKKFFKEFKDFISRGNVLDMAVGIIVGGAFTAIINALVNNILTPLLNLIPGTGDTGALQVVLRDPVVVDGNVVTEALVIDFGAVISAIITFLITAFVLFLIIKTINSIRAGGKRLAAKQKKAIEKRLKNGEISEEEAAKATEEIEAPAEAPVAAAVTTEQLLAEIRDLLKAQQPVENNEEKPQE